MDTYCEGLTLSSRDLLKQTSVGKTLIHQKRVRELLNSPQKQNTSRIWIQGSEKFIRKMLEWMDPAWKNKVTIACSTSTRRSSQISKRTSAWNLHWVPVSHVAVGGVSNGSWRIGVNEQCDVKTITKRCGFEPVVQDIVRSTESGPDWAEERMIEGFKTGKLGHMGDKVVWGDWNRRYAVPCVFTSSKTCVRPLSQEEIMDTVDLGKDLQSLVKAEPRNQLKFTEQVPLKILHRVATEVILTTAFSNSGLSEGGVPGAETVNDQDCGIGEGRNDGGGVQNNPSVTDVLDSVGNRVANKEGKLDMDVGASPSVGLSGQKLKAVTDDDAEANFSDWNARVGDHFWTRRAETEAKLLPGEFWSTGEYQLSALAGPLEVIRAAVARYSARKVTKSFCVHLNTSYGNNWFDRLHNKRPVSINTSRKRKRSMLQQDALKTSVRRELIADLEVGRDAIRRAGLATFWEWSAGSTIYFWRWPREYHKELRDGLPCFIVDDLPDYWARQQWPSKDAHKIQLLKKLTKVVLNRKYIEKGFVESLTSYFAVPKGETDIRVVYDATKSGLNDALWSPSFFLPTVESILRNAGMETYFADIDLGEMFLNYWLDMKVRPYAGVDVSELKDLFDDGGGTTTIRRIVMRWARCLMGLKSSPYNCTRVFSWSEDIIRGDRSQEGNPFEWDSVILNLPGSEEYKPDDPWVYRWNSRLNKKAAFFGSYIDDIRSGDSSREAVDRTTHVIASKINYLGQQDAARKRRRGSKEPGAWSGAMMLSEDGKGLFVSCLPEKWNKVKTILDRWIRSGTEAREAGEKWYLEHKDLEKDRGFLIHMARTYPMMVPYLKGIHHTLESWRIGRDEDGWKFSRAQWEDLLEGEGESVEGTAELEELKMKYKNSHLQEAPAKVQAVRRLMQDLESLAVLFEGDLPTKRLIRGSDILDIIYGFGDASGAGFGASWKIRNEIKYRYGLWGSDLNGSSSNFRELKNLVDTLLQMEKNGELEGRELFLCTDNSTAERAFFKGASSSKLLHDLILTLRKLEMRAKMRIHFVHVSGKRMIKQGSDGLSRGNLNEGVMQGIPMSEFVPLHLSATQRSPGLTTWIKSWLEDKNQKVEFLQPEDWFVRGHDLNGGEENSEGIWLPKYKPGTFVWIPPPAAADAAIEELRKARHKRQDSMHVFVCPRLMTPYWKKHVHKSADLILEIPPGKIVEWPEEMFEPLTVALYFPFLNRRPWQLRNQPLFLEMGRKMRSLFQENPRSAGSILRKFRVQTRALRDMPEKLVQQVLQGRSTGKFLHGAPRKRRRSSVEEKEGRRKVPKRKKW